MLYFIVLIEASKINLTRIRSLSEISTPLTEWGHSVVDPNGLAEPPPLSDQQDEYTACWLSEQ